MSAKVNVTFNNIKDYYIGTLRKYVVLEGRARRFEFWNFTICNMVMGIIPIVGLIKAVKRIRVWQSKAGFSGFFLGFIEM